MICLSSFVSGTIITQPVQKENRGGQDGGIITEADVYMWIMWITWWTVYIMGNQFRQEKTEKQGKHAFFGDRDKIYYVNPLSTKKSTCLYNLLC